MQQLASRWLVPALAASVLGAPSVGSAQQQGTMASVQSAAARVVQGANQVAPNAVQTVQQKVGGGSTDGSSTSGTAGKVVQAVQQKIGGSSTSGGSTSTAGKVVDAVKQAAAPSQPDQSGSNGTVTQRAVGAVKKLASRRSQPAQPAAAAPTPAPVNNGLPPNMPPNMPRPAAPSGGGAAGGAPPP